MERLQNYSVRSLSIEESCQINGGEAIEGSYGWGYSIGNYIRNFWITLGENSSRVSHGL
ncbi:hypothetical protein [Marinifilum fragile]|uniref:hypothetical protein n=1 Tax=Marinifilum fragile TaxID=570161 RepID=UPI002AA829E1|nr:hypothetical protein [Marinifilum fragile]